MKTSHAMLFRLSNKLIEVVFDDKSEIILNSNTRDVVYIDKNGVWETYSITRALTSPNTEMTRRLKYSKEILENLVSSKQNGAYTGNVIML